MPALIFCHILACLGSARDGYAAAWALSGRIVQLRSTVCQAFAARHRFFLHRRSPGDFS